MRLFEQRIKLRDDAGEMPALGFGTLISDSRRTREVVRTAVEMGFRHLDAAERYRNEAEVGEALKDVFDAGTVRRDDLFLTTKLWNNNHRPERVKPALQASLRRLGVEAADLYLMHTPPFAFRPGDDQDPPRDDSGAVVYDDGVTLEETWAAMEELVDAGLTRAIGLSDIDVEAPAESSPRPGSNRRSWKWKRTPTTRSGSCMTIAEPKTSPCSRSRRWGGMPWSRGFSMTRSSSPSRPTRGGKPRPRCSWPGGASSAAPRFSRRRSASRG